MGMYLTVQFWHIKNIIHMSTVMRQNAMRWAALSMRGILGNESNPTVTNKREADGGWVVQCKCNDHGVEDM